jgi:hypothetical protein
VLRAASEAAKTEWVQKIASVAVSDFSTNKLRKASRRFLLNEDPQQQELAAATFGRNDSVCEQAATRKASLMDLDKRYGSFREVESKETGSSGTGGDGQTVQNWLMALQIPSADAETYAEALKQEGFDVVEHLQDLEVEDMREIGMKKGHARALRRALASMNNESIIDGDDHEVETINDSYNTESEEAAHFGDDGTVEEMDYSQDGKNCRPVQNAVAPATAEDKSIAAHTSLASPDAGIQNHPNTATAMLGSWVGTCTRKTEAGLGGVPRNKSRACRVGKCGLRV